MLTYETVLKVFSDYLEKEPHREVVKVKHGYLVIWWDNVHGDYQSFDDCKTPEELRDRLTGLYSDFLLCADNGDPSEDEIAEADRKADILRRQCI